MRRALLVSAYGPVLGSGRALRVYTTARALAALGPLDFAYAPHDGAEPSPEYRAIEGVEFHPIVPSRGLRRAAAFAGHKARGLPRQPARAVSPELVETAARLARAPGRGRVVAADLNAMTAMLALARELPVTYNAHNLESGYRHPGHGHRVWSHLALRALERRVLRRAQESWMVSRADVEGARRLVPEARLRYVPNVVDVAAIEPVAPRADRRHVLMVGDFTYAPNRSGAALLAHEAMPRVWRERPDARLRLVGRGLDPAAFGDERVEVAGFVPDIAAAYGAADAVAVPLREGGGTPLKFVEALAYGVPVVATPLAARGLDARAGEHYLEGADPAGFAAQLVAVLRDGAPEVGARARELAAREYSIETVVRLLAA